MSSPRSSHIAVTLTLAVALLMAGMAAWTVSSPPADASVGAAGAMPRSVADDTVLGSFESMGAGFSDSFVYTLALQGDDTVYAGGSFSSATGVSGTSRIAMWSNNDDTWHGVGGSPNGDIYALAVQGDDTVYAGGAFSTIGGVTALNVAAWSSADDTWHALGSGADNTVFALAVRGDDTAYVGGRFNSAGGVSGTDFVAAWSNTDGTWHALGSGLNDRVLSLSVQGDDTVYAGGRFTFAGGDYLAGWSLANNAWSAIGAGTDAYVYALGVQGDETVYVGGAFTDAGTTTANQVARWSIRNGTWQALSSGTNGDVKALAVDEARGLLYVAGSFTTAGSLSGVNQVAVWDTGLSTWLPLQAAGGVGVGSTVNAIAANDSVVYLGGAFTTAGGVSASRIVKWTWGAPTAAAVPATGGNNATIRVRGSRLIGVSGVRINGSPAAYTRDDSTTVSVAIPGNLYDGTYSIQVDAVGGTAATTYTVTGSPAPRPPEPAGAPTDVTAIAGNASATVTWSVPASSGSYPVTYYQAVTSPGGAQCLVSSSRTSCVISGLSNGATYTATVRALTGAGWSAASQPSNPVIPARATITITGSRSGSVIAVTGTSTGLGMGAILKPWVRLTGQGSATQGSANILVDAGGSFAWQRRASKESYVHMATTDGSARSNTVVIPAR